MSTTYTIKVYCTNCEFEGEVEIEKGTPVEKKECPKCGCKQLQLG